MCSPKLALFVNGRKNVFTTLQKHISETDEVIWIHAASLGEYEQGLPILEKLKTAYPTYKLLLTFFSPSGYEVKKNNSIADVVLYLPLDSRQNAIKFIRIAHPKLAIFIKYEIWPNYISELKKKMIPALLISARFKESQVFFKTYGGLMRRALESFSHIHVQDNNSKNLLNSIGIKNVTVTGDTRLDRVSEILERDNNLDFMEIFVKDNLCFIAGSTWPEDEELITDFINTSTSKLKFVIAPHNIKPSHISALQSSLQKPSMLYSNLKKENLENTEAIIIDTIGILTKIYSYATIAYVGGGFATGLHNTLEPSVFGIPVMIGPDYKGFIEAEDLVRLGGLLPIKDKNGFFKTLNKLVENKKLRKDVGEINVNYILNNKGASIQIMEDIRRLW